MAYVLEASVLRVLVSPHPAFTPPHVLSADFLVSGLAQLHELLQQLVFKPMVSVSHEHTLGLGTLPHS